MKKWAKLFIFAIACLVVGLLVGAAWGSGVQASGLTSLVYNIHSSAQRPLVETSTGQPGIITTQFTSAGVDIATGMSHLTLSTDLDAGQIDFNRIPFYTFIWETDTRYNGLYETFGLVWTRGFSSNALASAAWVDNRRESSLYNFRLDSDGASNGLYRIDGILAKAVDPEVSVLGYDARGHFYDRVDILEERKGVKREQEYLRGLKLPITNIGSVIFLEGIIGGKQEVRNANKN